MARKAKRYDDLEEMRKDADKLGEELHISPAGIRSPVTIPEGQGAKPVRESAPPRGPARKRAAKARKDEGRA